jgi:hypothetical protein
MSRNHEDHEKIAKNCRTWITPVPHPGRVPDRSPFSDFPQMQMPTTQWKDSWTQMQSPSWTTREHNMLWWDKMISLKKKNRTSNCWIKKISGLRKKQLHQM